MRTFVSRRRPLHVSKPLANASLDQHAIARVMILSLLTRTVLVSAMVKVLAWRTVDAQAFMVQL
jgi:hypothetical protein